MEVVGLVAEGAGMSALACMPLGRRRALSCPDAERSRWAASGALISLEILLQLDDALHDLFESSPRFA
jgi:hypothetical protein